MIDFIRTPSSKNYQNYQGLSFFRTGVIEYFNFQNKVFKLTQWQLLILLELNHLLQYHSQNLALFTQVKALQNLIIVVISFILLG